MRLAAPARLALDLFGSPQLRLADGSVRALGRHDAAVLAYLAFEGCTPRSRLLEMLWPAVGPDTARNALRQRLFRLRRRVGQAVVGGNGFLSLAPAVAPPALEAASDAALLAGFDYADCPGFAAWLTATTARLATRRREALSAASEHAERDGALALAIALAEELIACEPLHEHGHRRLMRLHHLRGDRAAAIAAFEVCERLIRDELGLRPGPETLALLHQIEHAEAPSTGRARPVPPSVLRPPRLIGRSMAWAELQRAWEEALAVVIVADAGMGKSRLLGDLAMTRPGLVVVSARPGDASLPFALLTRIVRALLQHAATPLRAGVRRELARLLPELGNSRPLRNDADRARFLNAVQSLARQAIGQGLAGLALDDLHFADPASLGALPVLADVPGLRWLAAARRAELGAEASALIASWRATTAVLHIALPPLSVHDVTELLDSLAIGLDAAALAPTLHRRVGGNPLFLLESVKALLATGGVPPTPWPTPSRIDELMARRLAQLSAPAIRLARCAAVAGLDFSAELASAVLGQRTMDLVDAWSELEAAQVLSGGVFAHDLAFEVALASVPPPIARRLHGEIAQWLRRRETDRYRATARLAMSGDAGPMLARRRASATPVPTDTPCPPALTTWRPS